MYFYRMKPKQPKQILGNECDTIKKTECVAR
jgi:hypothetical protein